MRFREDIQVLRAVSIIAVLAYHVYEPLLPSGYLGVDLFFVISGYVVTPLIFEIFSKGNKLAGILEFFRFRFWRLAPALISILSISYIFMFFLTPVFGLPTVTKQMLYTSLGVGNYGSYKLTGDYFNPKVNAYLHTWSLAVEVQIYLILPLVIAFALLVRGVKPSNLLKILTLMSFVLFVFLFFNSLSFEGQGIDPSKNLNFYSPFSRFWQFGVGGLASIHRFNIDRKYFKILNSAKPLVWIMLLGLFFLRTPSAGATVFMTFFGATVLVIGSSFGKCVLKILVPIGDSSYSIYLVHYPLLYILSSTPGVSNDDFFLRSLLGFSSSILLGVISFRTIERRYRKRRSPSYSVHTDFKLSDLKIVNFAKYILIFLILPGLSISGSQIISNDFLGFNRNVKIVVSGNQSDSCKRTSDHDCLYSAGSEIRSVSLMGDSHASQFSSSLWNSLKVGGFSLNDSSLTSCQVFNPNSEQWKEYVTLECIKHNEAVLKQLIKSPPAFLVISQRSRDLNQVKATFDFISLIDSSKTRVVYIGVTPVFSDMNSLNEGSLLFPNIDFPVNFVPFASVSPTLDQIRQLEKYMSNRYGIDYIDSFEIICPSKICYRKKNGSWLYVDDNHLSRVGADLYLKSFSKVFGI